MSPPSTPFGPGPDAARLDEKVPGLNPLHPPITCARADANAAKLYGAIVAQARLPVFYRALAVPDTLEGRFLVLSLLLFAVLRRFKQQGREAQALAQALSDRFSEDIETVLREIGVGDLSIPKKVRRLAASSGALFAAYAEALPAGDAAVAAVIAEALGEPPSDATLSLAHYLRRVAAALEGQDIAALAAGEVRFAEVASGQELGT
jgi:cytochrome b pre-mRNA-processing protein 3